MQIHARTTAHTRAPTCAELHVRMCLSACTNARRSRQTHTCSSMCPSTLRQVATSTYEGRFSHTSDGFLSRLRQQFRLRPQRRSIVGARPVARFRSTSKIFLTARCKSASRTRRRWRRCAPACGSAELMRPTTGECGTHGWTRSGGSGGFCVSAVQTTSITPACSVPPSLRRYHLLYRRSCTMQRPSHLRLRADRSRSTKDGHNCIDDNYSGHNYIS